MILHGVKKTFQLAGVLAFLGGSVWLGQTPVFAQVPGQMEKTVVSQELNAGEWTILAKSPGVEIVSQSLRDPGKVVAMEENPRETAQNWLSDKGFEEGRNLYKDKLLYFSIGSAVINATPDTPDFVDSRYLAFQRAELEAKAKAAIFLGVDLTTARGSSEREINPQERAELEQIVNTSPTLQKNMEKSGIAQSVYALFQKGKRLAEAKLDQALQEAGVDVQAEEKRDKKLKAEQQSKQNRAERLRNISDTSMKAAASAFADVQGMQIFQSFEGSTEGGYQVVVISLWSQNLQRLVESMRSGTAPEKMEKRKAKEEVTRQLPNDPQQLACLSGVRAYINQHGENVLLAFGQAGVEVIGGRRDKAYELAGKKARLRAMAAMRNFMGEKVAFENVEELREVLALYADEAAGGPGESDYKSISQFSEMIEAEAAKEKISGIHGLQTYKLNHPFTDKPMVLKIMAWSPESQAMAAEVKRMIQHGADVLAEPEKPQVEMFPKKSSPSRKGLVSSGKGGDLDAI